ncbi:MAG: hypothetical protein JJE35_12360 [Thermoleophilia bacterium]|nr:hypothetical protein [Thermoleophilia bacterium]
MRRHSPALPIACVALFVALGGSVLAATKIDGHSIRARSLPGNRLVPGSLPGNRLRVGAIPADRLAPGSITGAQVDATTLGEVPSAVHAESATAAREAATALRAASAADAEHVNGYSAGCGPGTRAFAGGCWQLQHSLDPLEAPAAAAACAAQGGELPEALALAAFSHEPGVALAIGDEWTGEIAVASGPGLYSVATVSPSAVVSFALSTMTRNFRCVIPLVS